MSQWEIVVKAKLAHSSVPFVVAINPSSGVGVHKDSNFVSGTNKLKAAKITVIGYVYTGYGTRDHDVIKSEITKYKEWYNLDGIMFDEMSNQIGYEMYYKSLTSYTKSLGMKFTKGNPGTNVPASYMDVVDNFVMYENHGYPNLSKLKDLHMDYDKKNLSFVSYGVSSLDTQYIIHASNCVGMMYITDNVMPNPYDSIPSYFENLVSALDNNKYE